MVSIRAMVFEIVKKAEDLVCTGLRGALTSQVSKNV